MTNQTLENNVVENNVVENNVVENNVVEKQVANVSNDIKAVQVVRGEDGKFKRRVIYEPFSSVVATTTEEKICLYNLINGDSEEVQQMKQNIGKKVKVVNVIVKPFDSVDEITGEITEGVNTMLFDEDGTVYATSSKSVYHSTNNAFTIFGLPGSPGYTPLTFEIVEKKGTRYKYIDVKLIG